MSRPQTALLGLAGALLAACTGLGPMTIPRDQFDYGAALSSALNEQLLLNIVKLRYMEAPMFLEVSSVISQYAWVTEGGFSRTWLDLDTANARVSGRFEDRPTITYAPVVGREFTQSLLTPVPPGALLFLVQSGWPVDFVFNTCVQAMNGHFNRGGSRVHGHMAPEPGFAEAIDLLMHVQGSGAIGMRVEGVGEEQSAAFVFRRRRVEAVEADRARLRELLHLSGTADHFTVRYGADSTSDEEIAMLTRSLFEIIMEFSQQVDVPPEHAAAGRAYSPLWSEAAEPYRLIRIQSGEDAPATALVSVEYKGKEFWIDDADIRSKRTFAFLSILFNLTKTESAAAVPMVTVSS